MIEEQGNKAIDPDDFFRTYSSRSQQRDRERNHPLYKLEAEKKALIRDFGKNEITADCLQDVTRLNMLNRSIQKARELPEDIREISEEKLKTFSVELASIYKKLAVSTNTSKVSKEAIKEPSQNNRNKGKTYTLDQMTDMVNDQAKKNAPQKQAGM